MDLELRGAGNLLGGQQSGHIEAVGFEMYTTMLEETIRELKGENVQVLPETAYWTVAGEPPKLMARAPFR